MLTALARQRLIYPHSLLSHLSHRHSLQLQLQRHCHPFTPNLHRPSSTISDPTPKSPSASSPVAKRARLEDVQDSVDNLKMAFGATTPIPAAAAAGPPGWAEEAKSYGSFKLLQSFPIQYAPIGVAKWKSEKTGLSVVVGNHECEFVALVRQAVVADHAAPVVRSPRWTVVLTLDQWPLCHRLGK